MAVLATPQNFIVQSGNGQLLASWDAVPGATQYVVQRSTDNISYSTVSTAAPAQYLDTTCTLGTVYYYRVAASDGVLADQSAYTNPQSNVATQSGEMTLGQLRLAAQQRADRVGSDFVKLAEWNSYINQALFQLYDLLIDSDPEFFVTTPIQFATQANANQTFLYALPDGVRSYSNGITGAPNYVAPPFYRLQGVDLGLNTANNAWVSVNKFNFSDRNNFVYPNTSSTIYGVFNLQYRLVGNTPANSQIEFIPTPSAGQVIRIWYVPRLQMLLQDSDVTSSGVSGWLEYVILRAAILALTKEESDTTALVTQLADMQKRIEDSATNRDTGRPDTISNTRSGNWSDGWAGGGSGRIGGF